MPDMRWACITIVAALHDLRASTIERHSPGSLTEEKKRYENLADVEAGKAALKLIAHNTEIRNTQLLEPLSKKIFQLQSDYNVDVRNLKQELSALTTGKKNDITEMLQSLTSSSDWNSRQFARKAAEVIREYVRARPHLSEIPSDSLVATGRFTDDLHKAKADFQESADAAHKDYIDSHVAQKKKDNNMISRYLPVLRNRDLKFEQDMESNDKKSDYSLGQVERDFKEHQDTSSEKFKSAADDVIMAQSNTTDLAADVNAMNNRRTAEVALLIDGRGYSSLGGARALHERLSEKSYVHMEQKAKKFENDWNTALVDRHGTLNKELAYGISAAVGYANTAMKRVHTMIFRAEDVGQQLQLQFETGQGSTADHIEMAGTKIQGAQIAQAALESRIGNMQSVQEHILDGMWGGITQKQEKVLQDAFMNLDHEYGQLDQYLANKQMSIDGTLGGAAARICLWAKNTVRKTRLAYQSALMDTIEGMLTKMDSFDDFEGSAEDLQNSEIGTKAIKHDVDKYAANVLKLTNKLKTVLDAAKETELAGEELGRKFMLESDKMGEEGSRRIQAVEKKISEEILADKNVIMKGIKSKPQKAMADIINEVKSATTKAESFKNHAGNAESTMETKAEALATASSDLRSLHVLLATTGNTILTTAKNLDMHSRNDGDELSAITESIYSKTAGELSSGTEAAKESLSKGIDKSVTDVNTAIEALRQGNGHLAQQIAEQSKRQSDARISSQQTAGFTGKAAQSAVGNADKMTSSLVAGLDDAVRHFSQGYTQADTDRYAIENDAHKAEQGDEATEDVHLRQVLDNYNSHVGDIAQAIFGTLVHADKKFQMDTESADAHLQGMLKSNANGVREAQEAVAALLKSGDTSLYANFEQEGKDAVALAQKSQEAIAHLAMKLGVSEVDLWKQIIKSTNDLQVGPGGVRQQLLDMRHSIWDELDGFGSDREKVLAKLKISATEVEDSGAATLRSMRENGAMMSQDVNSASTDITDNGALTSQRLASSLQNIKSGIQDQESRVAGIRVDDQDSVLHQRMADITGKLQHREAAMAMEDVNFKGNMENVVNGLDISEKRKKADEAFLEYKRKFMDAVDHEKAVSTQFNTEADNVVGNVKGVIDTDSDKFPQFKYSLREATAKMHSTMDNFETKMRPDMESATAYSDEISKAVDALHDHVNGRRFALHKKIGIVGEQLERVVGALSFGKSSAIETAAKRVAEAAESDKDILSHVEGAVNSQADKLRSETDAIFQNIDLVQNLANVEPAHVAALDLVGQQATEKPKAASSPGLWASLRGVLGFPSLLQRGYSHSTAENLEAVQAQLRAIDADRDKDDAKLEAGLEQAINN